MSNFYISKENIVEALNYFQNKDFSGSLALSYYLGFRHLGLTMRNPVVITSTLMNDEYKSDYIDTWNKMFTLLDPMETADKIFGISPFDIEETIKKSNLYNPGTALTASGIVSRPKDSLKNIVRTINFVDYQGDYVYATRKTPEIIQDNCLNTGKISLKYFASWFFRFYGFSFEKDSVSEIDFSRVVKKTIFQYFKITKNDFTWLFEDDILNDSFTPSKEIISGKWLRQNFAFDNNIDSLEGTIKANSSPLIHSSYEMLHSDRVKEYIKLVGDNPSDESILETLFLKKQLILTGVPGTGKSRFLTMLKEKFERSELVQFHANYSYEHFIGGETLVNGTIESKMGLFLKFCTEASNNPNLNYLFIIDEINRGNIAQIFGETILTLDRKYSAKLARPMTTEMGQKLDEFVIPENVYIAASMNTADRNIAFLDLAIRRRFAFIEILPNYEVLSALVRYRNFDLGNILKNINNSILNSLGKEELFLGQSYFLNDEIYDGIEGKYIWDDEKFLIQFNYVILPTLKEYTFSDKNALISIVGEELSAGIRDIDTFIMAFENFFGQNGEI